MEISKMLKRAALVAGFGAMGLMGSDSAQAAGSATAANTIAVSATVAANCTVTVPNGANMAVTYDFSNPVWAGTPITTRVQCSAGVAYTVRYESAAANVVNGGPNAGYGRMILAGATLPAVAGDYLDYRLTSDCTAATADLFAGAGGATAGSGATAYEDYDACLYVDPADSPTPNDGTFNDSVSVNVDW